MVDYIWKKKRASSGEFLILKGWIHTLRKEEVPGTEKKRVRYT